MKNALFTMIFAAILMVGTLSAQSAVACQDGLTVTLRNANAVILVGMDPIKDISWTIVMWDQNNSGPHNGGYYGEFYEGHSSLKIDGVPAKATDLRKIHTTVASVKFHMLVTNGKCGPKGISSYTSIEVTIKKK